MALFQLQGAHMWLVIGGWVAVVTVLAYTIRIMRKPTRGHPELLSEFQQTWARPFQRFPLHADLPRLARKVLIHTADGTTLETPDNALHAIKHVILGLAEQLVQSSAIPADKSRELKKAMDEAFLHENPESVELQLFVKELISNNHELLGPSLLGLLKTITQDIVAPGVIKMKTQLTATMPYKDVRGEWHIDISFAEPGAVIVTHRKREQSFGHKEGQEFEFQWNLALKFDSTVSMLQTTELYIPELSFGPNASEETKSRITLLLDDYLSS